MKNRVVFVAFVVFVAGCGSGTSSTSSATKLAPVSSSGALTMTMSFDPSPPKQGNETISLAVTDLTGKAVRGAAVEVTTKMPAMSMIGPALTLQDNGDGTYSAVTNMNFQTKWVLDVKAVAGGRSATAEFDQDVN